MGELRAKRSHVRPTVHGREEDLKLFGALDQVARDLNAIDPRHCERRRRMVYCSFLLEHFGLNRPRARRQVEVRKYQYCLSLPSC